LNKGEQGANIGYRPVRQPAQTTHFEQHFQSEGEREGNVDLLPECERRSAMPSYSTASKTDCSQDERQEEVAEELAVHQPGILPQHLHSRLACGEWILKVSKQAKWCCNQLPQRLLCADAGCARYS
jgi:hypothetical protein